MTHRGTRAVQRMVEYAPSTGGLALWVRHQDLPADAGLDVPLVATDGKTLYYAPDFEQRPIEEQAGWVAHEVLHIALRHPQRYVDLQRLIGDVDLALFNLCADAIVNSTLAHVDWLHLPKGAVVLERLMESALGVFESAEKSLLEWDVERLYRAIDDRRPPRPTLREQRAAQRDQRGGSGGARADTEDAASPAQRSVDGPRAAAARALGAQTAPDLQPGTTAQSAPEAEAEAAREWSERLIRSHAGDGAFSMLRTLGADLPRTRTPWEQVLRTQLARALAPRPALSWSRPSRSYLANQGRAGVHRRMPWEPGTSGTRAVPRLVVIVDVSGSIDNALVQRFAREIEALTRRLEAALVLVIGDDQVRRIERFDPDARRPAQIDLHALEFQGGGGTDFTPLLEEADTHRPDIGVVLTDLEGPARFRPRWPLIWAVPEACSATVAPFGRKLGLR